jgi:hypothetical protein
MLFNSGLRSFASSNRLCTVLPGIGSIGGAAHAKGAASASKSAQAKKFVCMFLDSN